METKSQSENIKKQLAEKLSIKNPMMLPKVEKVVLNMGVGEAVMNKNAIPNAQEQLTQIAGQKAVVSLARKSISAFKLRQGTTIGVAVTLRGQRMYDFLDKLINVTFPRVRDFRGVDPKKIDRTGNLSVGFKEHIAFPEIKADEVDNIHGLEINITTSAKTAEEGLELFHLIGFPFKKDN